MIFIIDIIIIVCCLIILVDFQWGSIVYLLSSFILPGFVAFRWGAVNLNVTDIMLLAMLASFFLHKSKLRTRVPIRKVLNLLSFYVLPTVAVLVLSSYVPKNIQLYELAKNVMFHMVVPVVFLFYAFSNSTCNERFIKGLCAVSLIIGMYGLLCYLTNENPYMKVLNYLYYNEYRFEDFIKEVRGGLSGRVSGTLNHPLAWGQLWGVLLSFFVWIKEKINPIYFKVIVVVGGVNVLFSGSRSALVALFPILVCYAISSGGLKTLRTMGLYTIVAVALSYTVSEKMQSYMESAIFFWDESKSDAANIGGSGVDMRMRQFETALFDVSHENLLAGYGLGYLQYSAKKNVRNDDMLGFESVFFQKMYEQGLLGFICFLVFIFKFYEFGSRRFTRNKRILYFGYCSSYLLSILFTGIQNTFGWFVYLGVFLVLFNRCNLEEVNAHKQ